MAGGGVFIYKQETKMNGGRSVVPVVVGGGLFIQDTQETKKEGVFLK